MQPMAAPTDPLYPQQWHYSAGATSIRLPGALDRSTGAGVTVGVVDSGITAHPDLNPGTGYDFITDPSIARDGSGRDANPADEGDWSEATDTTCNQYQRFIPSSWHGTHVAGTIAARTNNGVGVAGVAGGIAGVHGPRPRPLRRLVVRHHRRDDVGRRAAGERRPRQPQSGQGAQPQPRRARRVRHRLPERDQRPRGAGRHDRGRRRQRDPERGERHPGQLQQRRRRRGHRAGRQPRLLLQLRRAGRRHGPRRQPATRHDLRRPLHDQQRPADARVPTYGWMQGTSMARRTWPGSPRS